MTRDRSTPTVRIRAGRPAKTALDAWQPLDVVAEEERLANGEVIPSWTVFLTGSECPFTCVFCDLWQYTLDEPTPAGAVPYQIELALRRIPSGAGRHTIKLYNASNFFEARAVPPGDLPAIARLLADWRRVTVECHPRLVGNDTVRFAAMLEGKLEVAMGLETVHPEALAKLNKEMRLSDFETAAALLLAAGIGLRVFVQLNPPFVPRQDRLEWAMRSVEFAARLGAEVVSVIPTRGSAGEMSRLEASGAFQPLTLEELDDVCSCLLRESRGLILVDLWDVEKLDACGHCAATRIERLRLMNRTGRVGPEIVCSVCCEQRGG